MTELNSQELAEVACNILETIVFAFTEPLEGIPSFNSEKFLTAEVSFEGIHSGLMTLTAPESLCQEWADMMSTQKTETIHLDTLAELANIIAGHWVSRQFSDRELPKLNPPRVSATSIEQWKKIQEAESVATLSVDSLPLILSATVSN